ncbi:swarming motility protein YbiA [Pectobacterium actinidiae]|uniref:N-glycosidase YbiA n=1 Tax=Pectobacterium actinidiae TaxID=1507808 RepID=A0A1V2QZ29_9GAMM|nr:NADAR family protein [Pectobacterium actinidiae]ONK01688.1 swarming motility protein YbiA [Pectobacterium actinidiae]ONK01862.1 swarming motility protein YbiA [Pectobacterium actinidiae]
MSDAIFFYRVNEPYGVFSNFFKCNLIIDSITWPTVEHYFQSQKFQDEVLKEKIRNLLSPMDAAKLGRDRSLPLRKDWDDVKNNIMRFAVLEKFKQNTEAKEILLSTEDTLLVEHTHNDNYWADGGDGSGKNMLGIILMETREALKV